MIKIYVIDESPVFIDEIKSIILPEKDKMRITGYANSVKEALPMLKQSSADIVILDLDMPNNPGVEFCSIVKNQLPDKKVVALTSQLDSTLIFNTWMNLADAILMKDYIKEDLVDIIRGVIIGKRILGRKVPEFYEELKEYNKKS